MEFSFGIFYKFLLINLITTGATVKRITKTNFNLLYKRILTF